MNKKRFLDSVYLISNIIQNASQSQICVNSCEKLLFNAGKIQQRKFSHFGCSNKLSEIHNILHNSNVRKLSIPFKSSDRFSDKTVYDFIFPSRSRDHDPKHPDDTLFDMFKNEETDLLPIGKFLSALKGTGIRKTDPRLNDFMANLKTLHKKSGFEGSSAETQKLNRENFKEAIAPNIVLISRAFKNQFVIPDFQDFIKDIEEMYWVCKSNSDGKVATYIPQLARVNPDLWGISVCTIDGQRFSIGDVTVPFTLQSTSKPLMYAMALETLGPDVVHQYVGTEPSGRNFNELVLDHNMKPHNPMINAGAILVCSLLKTLVKPEMTLAEKYDYVMDFFKTMAGNEPLGFNNATFLSEREAADRNYALGFYMREHKCYPKKAILRECMDFYFQCCAMEANCDTASVIAATLANGGICPITEEQILKADSVRNVLSLMHSCGMYDYSGEFAFKVGLPAKSGVSGAMLIVVPNIMGICVWSPPLDTLGNSCRGVQFCVDLVERFNFHRYDNLKYAANKKNPRRYKFETTGLSIVNLLFSAASGDLNALRRHRLSGMDMSLSDYDGRTALHLAAAEGHLSCVEFLLLHCNVPHDPHDRWGNTPLKEATLFGHQNVINFMQHWMENHALPKAADCQHRLSGMDMSLSDYDGRTALHLAAAEGHLPCVEFLLLHCNVPHEPHDRWGNTPLKEAKLFGHQNVAEFLENWSGNRVLPKQSEKQDNSLPEDISSEK